MLLKRNPTISLLLSLPYTSASLFFPQPLIPLIATYAACYPAVASLCSDHHDAPLSPSTFSQSISLPHLLSISLSPFLSSFLWTQAARRATPPLGPLARNTGPLAFSLATDNTDEYLNPKWVQQLMLCDFLPFLSSLNCIAYHDYMLSILNAIWCSLVYYTVVRLVVL